VLDDLKFIHNRDGQDALGIAEKKWQQLLNVFELPHIPLKVSNVVYAGMGGSALAALVAKSWPGLSLPFEVCRNYQVPAYVSRDTLFIAASYSGNTEETLSALAEAEVAGAQIFIITGGGKLKEWAETKDYPFLVLPKVVQPRFADFYNLVAIVSILDAVGITTNKLDELPGTADFLKKEVESWLPTVPIDKNPAKKLAQELAGKSLAVYGGPLMAPVAYKWKINFNESAKNVAWWNELPEFDHNELTGWTSHPVDKPYGIVEIRSNLEHARVQQRFEVGERLLSGRRPAPHVVEAQGETLLEQIVWSINFGDFVAIYLALINNQDPSPVDLVEKFKKELG